MSRAESIKSTHKNGVLEIRMECLYIREAIAIRLCYNITVAARGKAGGAFAPPYWSAVGQEGQFTGKKGVFVVVSVHLDVVCSYCLSLPHQYGKPGYVTEQ